MKMKKFVSLACVLALLLAGCGSKSNSEAGGSTPVAEGQTEVYGIVTEIVGNEITVELGALASGGKGDGGMPNMDGFGAEMPEGMEDFDPGSNGEMPNMDNFGGELPEGFGELPEGFDESMMGGMVPGAGGSTVQGNGETVTYTVAVDTPVTVSGNDKVTTFSKIAAVNSLRIVLYEGTDTVATIEILG